MPNKRFRLIIDIHLLLIKDNQILLIKRQNTGYEDGKYHFPAGHLEEGEPTTLALIRESREEIGIKIQPENCRLCHVMHNKSNNERISLFFEVKKWQGEIKNMEPEKCAEIKWFNIGSLPENMVSYLDML
jgi:mutator protein MutT